MTLRCDLAAFLPRLRQADVTRFCTFYEKYAPHLPTISADLYERLDAADRTRFLTWMLKRWAKIDLVNRVERGLYDAMIEQVKHEDRPAATLGDTAYRVRDFKGQGHDFRLLGYDWFLGVHDVYYNQYENDRVQLKAGDVIIDAGAFIGDTAVFFDHKLKGDCRIHSFELLDENLALLVHNLDTNGVADERVVLNKLALTDRTGDEISVGSGATQGSTSIFGQGGRADRVQTITLDDYVVRMGLDRVDFIKMDIEGAEAQALAGARQTIAHFQPRLAICLYHRWDDVFTLPALIHACGVDYDFGFKWVQLSDGWEAVLLAAPRATPGGAAARTAPTATDASDDAVLSQTMAVLCKAVLARPQAPATAGTARPAAVPATAPAQDAGQPA